MSSRCFKITNDVGGEDGSDEQVETNAKLHVAQQHCLNKGCENVKPEDKEECNRVCRGIFGDFDMEETKGKCKDQFGIEKPRSFLINNKCSDGIQGCLTNSMNNLMRDLKNVLSGSNPTCLWTKIHTTRGFNKECKEEVKSGWISCKEINEIPENHCIAGACKPENKKRLCKIECSELTKDIEKLKSQLDVTDKNIEKIKKKESPKEIASKCTAARKEHAELTRKLREKEQRQKELEGIEEGFKNNNDLAGSLYKMPTDPLIQIYYSSIGLLMLYILLKILHK